MNIISVDYKLRPGDEKFAESFREVTGKDWQTDVRISNYPKRTFWFTLKRYYSYLRTGLKYFRSRSEIKNIIAWQQFHGIFFAFFCHLFRVKKTTNLFILTLIYKRKKGFVGKLYERFMKFAIDDKYVDGIICFSQKEIQEYKNVFNVAANKYHFLLVAAAQLPAFDINPDERKFVFTAGYSHRDFKFLVDSLKGTRYNLVIADDRTEDPQEENIQILKGCYGDEMRKMIGKCFVFVNPLKDKTISSGQLMAITAMQLHKPVICTDSEGMHPYLINGKTGFFINNTKEELLSVLDTIYNDENLYNNMCNSAYDFAKEQFSWKRLGRDIALIGKNEGLF